ncbi:unnamed protein product, partial [Ixodes pacificus]
AGWPSGRAAGSIVGGPRGIVHVLRPAASLAGGTLGHPQPRIPDAGTQRPAALRGRRRSRGLRRTQTRRRGAQTQAQPGARWRRRRSSSSSCSQPRNYPDESGTAVPADRGSEPPRRCMAQGRDRSRQGRDPPPSGRPQGERTALRRSRPSHPGQSLEQQLRVPGRRALLVRGQAGRALPAHRVLRAEASGRAAQRCLRVRRRPAAQEAGAYRLQGRAVGQRRAVRTTGPLPARRRLHQHRLRARVRLQGPGLRRGLLRSRQAAECLEAIGPPDSDSSKFQRSRQPSEATFRGHEFLSLEAGRAAIVSGADQVSLLFKTRQPSALLWHSGDGADYMQLSLKDGGLLLSVSLGAGVLEKTVRPARVRFDDNQWHRVVVHRKVRQMSQTTSFYHLSITADGVYTERGSTAGSFSFLASSALYVGGTDAILAGPKRNNFVGCLRKVELVADSLQLDLIDLSRSGNRLVQAKGNIHFVCQEVDAADPVTFTTRDSFLALPSWDDPRTGSVSLRLRTVEPDGLLLYNSGSQGDLFALELLEGQLHLLLDLGSGPVKVRASPKRLHDGHWHQVQVTRSGRSGRLSVDDAGADYVTPVHFREFVQIGLLLAIKKSIPFDSVYQSHRRNLRGSASMAATANRVVARTCRMSVLRQKKRTRGAPHAASEAPLVRSANGGLGDRSESGCRKPVAFATKSCCATARLGNFPLTVHQMKLYWVGAGNSNQLDLEGPLFVGGAGTTAREDASSTLPGELWSGALRLGFVGCLRDLVVNGKAVDLASYAQRQDSGAVRPSCHRAGPQCPSTPCLHGGKCSEGWNRFLCDCGHTGFTGPVCAKEATTLRFNGEQFARIQLGRSSRSEAEHLRLRFQSPRPNGLLLATAAEARPQAPHTALVLSLESARLKVSYNLGDGNKVRTLHVGAVTREGPHFPARDLPGFVGQMQQLQLNGKFLFEMARQGHIPNLQASTLFGCPTSSEFKTDVVEDRCGVSYAQMTAQLGPQGEPSAPHQPVTFRSRLSFVGLPQLKAYSSMHLHFQFKTLEPSGLLLYNAGKGQDFVAVELVDGHLHYLFNLGDGPRKVRSNTASPLNDNRWHAVTLGRSSLRQHSLVVDDRVATVTSPGSNVHLDLDGLLYLGGVRRGGYSSLPKLLSSRTGFQGCLASLDLNGEVLHPLDDAVVPSALVARGCQGTWTPCGDGACSNGGSCVPAWNDRQSCDCDATSFSGPTCADESIAYKFGPRPGLVRFSPSGGGPKSPKGPSRGDLLALGFLTTADDAALVHVWGPEQHFLLLHIVSG